MATILGFAWGEQRDACLRIGRRPVGERVLVKNWAWRHVLSRGPLAIAVGLAGADLRRPTGRQMKQCVEWSGCSGCSGCSGPVGGPLKSGLSGAPRLERARKVGGS